MRSNVDQALAAVAATRASTFGMRDVVACGGDRWLAKRRTDSGRWLGPPGGPWVLAGVPVGLDQRRHLALLAIDGSVLTHESAAELHRLDGIRRGLVVVSTTHDHRHVPWDDVVVHRIDDLALAHRTTIDGFPTTTAARTIIDLAAVTTDARLKRAIESAIVDRRASFSAVAGVLQEVRRQGKTGVTRLVRVLDQLDGDAPPASVLERHLVMVMARTRIRSVRQHPLPWSHEPVQGCVDVAVPEAKLIVEADGRRWHARLDAMANDRRRDRAAVLAGWVVLRFVYKDLVDDPAGAATEIAAAVHARLT